MTHSYLIGFHLDAQGQAVGLSTAYREGFLVTELTRADRKGDVDCKEGKICGKRCIPKDQKCHVGAGINPTVKVAAGIGAGLLGASAIGSIAVAAAAGARARSAMGAPGFGEKPPEASKQSFKESAAKVKAFVQEEVDFAKHLSENPESRKTYQQAAAKAFEQGGSQGRRTAHEALKNHWRESQGKANPMASKAEGSSDWHKTLGVAKDASPEEIKSAYRALSKKHHPDVSKESGAAKKFEKINEAYAASKSRKDALEDRWQSIEQAYRTAQKVRSRVDKAFWRI